MKFKCVWDNSYHAPGTLFVGEDWFWDESNGYWPEVMANIFALGVGETFIVDLGHFVTRVQ